VCSSRLARLRTPSANHSQQHPFTWHHRSHCPHHKSLPHHNSLLVLRLDVKRQINTSCKSRRKQSSSPSLTPRRGHTPTQADPGTQAYVACFTSGAPGRLLKQLRHGSIAGQQQGSLCCGFASCTGPSGLAGAPCAHRGLRRCAVHAAAHPAAICLTMLRSPCLACGFAGGMCCVLLRLLLGSCVSALGGILHSLPVRLPPAARFCDLRSASPAACFARSVATWSTVRSWRSSFARSLRPFCARLPLSLSPELPVSVAYVASFPFAAFSACPLSTQAHCLGFHVHHDPP
jgi:hypothetical protein